MMKVLIFCLIISISGFSQVSERNILSQKYSLEFVSKNLIPHNKWKPYPKTSQEWQAILTPVQIDEIIKIAKNFLNSPIAEITGSMAMDFVRSGDRENHGKASYGRRNHLVPLIIAESIENKGRFTEKIFNLIWAICEESYWGVPAHIRSTGLPDIENPVVDLFAAETAAVLGLADYLIGEKMDNINHLIRKRIYFETNRRVLQPIKKWENYFYLSRTKPVNNWNPWIISNLLMANLFLEKNETRRAENVKDYLFHLDAYLNSLGDDGGCNEGPTYWFHAGASVFDFLEIMKSVSKGKINIYHEPLIKNMASYVYKMHISNTYFVNFADADPKIEEPDGLLLYRFGKAIDDEKMIAMGQWAFYKFNQEMTVPGRNSMRVMENLMYRNKIPMQTGQYQPSGTYYIADIQVLSSRTKQDLFLATHGGHNAESHNHNDVGDFIVYANGEPIIIDPGRGNYTARTQTQRYDLWYTQSNYHNLPIINGIGQRVGREFEAKEVKSIVNESEATLKMNIASAYEKEAKVQSWNRSISLNHQKNRVEILEDYVLIDRPISLQQVFMTVCKINIDTPGTIVLEAEHSKFEISYDPKLWKPSIELPSTEGMEYKKFKTNWGGKPVSRIILENKTLKQKGKYGFVVKELSSK